jgi:hypothetical protein
MPVTTTTVSGQQSIPAELMPFFNKDESTPGAGDQGILQRARQLTTRNYDTTYGKDLRDAGLAGSNRIASLSPMQQQVGQQLQSLQLDRGYGQARDIYGGMSDANQVGQYMNPYLQLALDPQSIRLRKIVVRLVLAHMGAQETYWLNSKPTKIFKPIWLTLPAKGTTPPLIQP